MHTARRIAKNTTLLFISQLIVSALSFLSILYTARYLGAAGFGILSFALSFSYIFFVIADLGLNTLTVREVARNKSLTMKYLGNVLLIKILLIFLTWGLVILFVNLLGYPQETMIVIYYVSSSVILTSFFGIFYSIFQAYEKMEYQSLGQILNSILMFVGVIIAINFGFDIIGFSILYLVSSVIVLAYNLVICLWKFSIPKIEYDKEFWKVTVKESLPYGLTAISVALYTYIDCVMLSLIQSNEVLGWYNAAYRLVLFLVFVPITINIAVFPSMSKFHISSPDSLKKMNEKYFKFMIILGIPVGIATTFLANKIILVVFGSEFIPSILTLQILIWTIVFTFAGAAFVRLLEATNKQLILTKITGISVVVNVLLNLVLIPKYSLIGASIVAVLTEIILVGMVFRVSYNMGYGIQIKKILDDLIRIIFASFVMAVFILVFINLNLVILVILATLVYVTVLLVVKGVDNEDIDIIKRVLNK
ncbi:MAG: membrane protein involved in the export of O-antigen and teichoic acid [Methanobacterium sp. Maddingley MBC34]|nr:MAG: membrane protein involved in the export of O-antigen and teichoic acid [Methanobacterium sp. Maddingley MBC34]